MIEVHNVEEFFHYLCDNATIDNIKVSSIKFIEKDDFVVMLVEPFEQIFYKDIEELQDKLFQLPMHKKIVLKNINDQPDTYKKIILSRFKIGFIDVLKFNL